VKENWSIRKANGKINFFFIETLLFHPDCDPTVNDYEPLREALERQDFAKIKFIVAHPKIDPIAHNFLALRCVFSSRSSSLWKNSFEPFIMTRLLDLMLRSFSGWQSNGSLREQQG